MIAAMCMYVSTVSTALPMPQGCVARGHRSRPRCVVNVNGATGPATWMHRECECTSLLCVCDCMSMCRPGYMRKGKRVLPRDEPGSGLTHVTPEREAVSVPMCHDSARVPMTARAGVRPERERAVRKGLVLRPKQAKSSESRGHAHGSHTAGPGADHAR